MFDTKINFGKNSPVFQGSLNIKHSQPSPFMKAATNSSGTGIDEEKNESPENSTNK